MPRKINIIYCIKNKCIDIVVVVLIEEYYIYYTVHIRIYSIIIIVSIVVERMSYQVLMTLRHSSMTCTINRST